MTCPSSVFIHIGQIHIDHATCVISTVLGSCVAVCLYDTDLGIGGMNHYLLPFWNGDGLQTPKFGNVAIPRLIESMISKGSTPKTMEAKIFGGAMMSMTAKDTMMIGYKNILVARDILREYRIPIIAEDVGGHNGRKIRFELEQGRVLLQYSQHSDAAEGR